jgi:hypothetical protein
VKSGRVDGATVGDEQPEPEFLEMNKTDFYYALNRAEDRAVERVTAIRQAERECLPYIWTDNRAMALDSGTPEELYMSALTALGVPPQDMEGLDLAALKAVFKIKTNGATLEGANSNTSGSSTLDSILAGVTAPQLTAGLALTGYTAPEAIAATTRSRGMAGDSRHGARGSVLDQILKNCGAKKPVDMSRARA